MLCLGEVQFNFIYNFNVPYKKKQITSENLYIFYRKNSIFTVLILLSPSHIIKKTYFNLSLSELTCLLN